MKLIRNFYFFFLTVINKLIFRINHVKWSSPTINGILVLINKGDFVYGKGLKINTSKYKNIIGGDTRSSISISKQAKLEIGDNFRMSNSAIHCAERITIGNNVMIGGSCKIWDTDFHPLDKEKRLSSPNEDYATKPIVIGDDVFVGGFSIVLKGTQIGKNSIIGAASVVSGVVPPNEIWAGNPAKFIKKN